MQLKNNKSRNVQLFFYKKDKSGRVALDFVHIPGNATVEIDDEIFKAVTSSLTSVEVMREEVVELSEDSIGAEVKSGKEALTIREFYQTGEYREVNLVLEGIKAGDFTVVQRVKVGMKEVEATLVANSIDIKDMSDETKLALFDKLV